MLEEQGSVVFSLMVGLLLFALVLFLAWFCTKWLGRRFSPGGSGDKVKVVERIAVGPDRMLAVVRAGKRVLLLGVTAHQINKIEELDPEEFEDDDTTERKPLQETSLMSCIKATEFSKALQNALGKRGHAEKQEKDKQNE